MQTIKKNKLATVIDILFINPIQDRGDLWAVSGTEKQGE